MTASIIVSAPEEELLVDAKEVARRLGFSYSSIVQWRRSGRIPGVKISRRCCRFRLSEVARALGVDTAEGDAA